MKKPNVYIAIFAVSVLVLTASCGRLGIGSSDYTSPDDNFSVAFPNGGSDLEIKDESVPYAVAAITYSKSFDNRTDNFRSYEVQVLEILPSNAEGKNPREIQEIALNGWEKEPGTQIKDITVDGQKGIDSLRVIELGEVGMAFREVVFWSEAKKKLYVIKVSAMKKENTTTPEADAFVNSFKLNA